MASQQETSTSGLKLPWKIKPGVPENDVEADLKRIEEIIKNARATWFALISGLQPNLVYKMELHCVGES